jgi:hypothetical protein
LAGVFNSGCLAGDDKDQAVVVPLAGCCSFRSRAKSQSLQETTLTMLADSKTNIYEEDEASVDRVLRGADLMWSRAYCLLNPDVRRGCGDGNLAAVAVNATGEFRSRQEMHPTAGDLSGG